MYESPFFSFTAYACVFVYLHIYVRICARVCYEYTDCVCASCTWICVYVYFLCVCVCVCVGYGCVYLFSFINYEISYTIDIIPIHEGEGIPIGGDRIGYTYTLTPIIKLSYFLFNRYKTTIALPWFSSALLFLHSYALSRRVSLSLSCLSISYIFFLFISLSLFPAFSLSAFDAHYSRSYTIYYHHNFVVVVYILLIIVGTVNNNISHSVPTNDRKLRAPRTLEQHACDYRGNLLIQDLAHHQSE